MQTRRDENTGALIYIKSKEDIEKEKTINNLKNVNKKINDIHKRIDKIEETLENIKTIEKRLSKIEKTIKELSKDGEK